MVKKRFVGILASTLAGSTALFATQAIATQETKPQAVDQYMIIDLPIVSVEWETTEEETSISETLSKESTEETDLSVAQGLYSYLDLIDCLTSQNHQETLFQNEYTFTGIRMNEVMITYLINEYSAYKNYGTVDIYEVTTRQPAADETNLYKLLLQVEDDANIVSYSHGILLNEEETEAFIKTPEHTYLNESGNTATAIDSETNHWLIVHLAPEVSIPEETIDAFQTSAEGDQTASESFEEKVDSEPETKPASTTTVAPTTAHTHAWVPVTTTVHHDATYTDVWVQDAAAWDENVLVSDAWDEPIYAEVNICNVCGYQYPLDATPSAYSHHALEDPGDGGGWYATSVQVGTTHHDAVYNTVHHDAVYNTVHHEATGHYEKVQDQAAWDETVTTGYKCSTCGATK